MKLIPSTIKRVSLASTLMLFSIASSAEVTLELDTKITVQGLYFDGIQRSVTQARNEPYVEGQKYNFAYGRSIVPHGDAIKVYKDYVFMTWYRGGLLDRHMMLTRYNMKTGKKVDIEFPHQHTGFEGRWWVGETHNTIAVAISPKDETIHLLFDMHAYTPGKDTGGNGSFQNDYFRYSYSVAGAATVADNEFTLAQFVKDTSATNEGDDDYKHVTMSGVRNDSAFGRLSYPTFFENDQGDIFLHMRQGSSYDGRIVFNKYDSDQKKWGDFKSLNVLGAGSKGDVKDWSIYGIMKYQDGKIRVGFQRRLNRPDKFYANEGMYYAYSDDPTGATDWKNYKGESIEIPIVAPDDTLVFDQSTLLPDATAKHQVSITGGFDWAVTSNGDVHLIGRVSERVSNKNVQTIYSHHYQKGGVGEFVTTTDFPSASEIYAAGENIYIIGLENNRPFIEQAKGGTNDFTRIYTAPAGSMAYEKGVVYIHEGKVYYYLLQAGSGDSRTTHLQVINLDLPPEGPDGYKYAAKEGETVTVTGTMSIAFGGDGNFTYLDNQTTDISCDAVTFSAPPSDNKQACFALDVTPSVAFANNELTLTEGYDSISIKVDAQTPVFGRTIKQVALSLSDTAISADNSAPYEWLNPSQLMDLSVGTHTVKAVVTDNANVTAETTMNIVVSPKVPPTITFAESELVLLEDYQDINVTVNAQTSTTTQEVAKVALYLGDTVISELTEAPYQWNQTSPQLVGLAAGSHTLTAVLTDINEAETQATMSVTVNAKATPSISFAQLPATITQGDAITITVNPQLPDNARAIANVALYVDNQFISKDDSAPYQWTQTSSQLANLTAGNHNLKAELTDSAGNTSIAVTNIMVKAKPRVSTPTETNPAEATPAETKPAEKESDSGGSTGIIALVSLALFTLRRKYH